MLCRICHNLVNAANFVALGRHSRARPPPRARRDQPDDGEGGKGGADDVEERAAVEGWGQPIRPGAIGVLEVRGRAGDGPQPIARIVSQAIADEIAEQDRDAGRCGGSRAQTATAPYPPHPLAPDREGKGEPAPRR